MIRQVEKVFDEQIRPALAAHGGDVEIIDIENDRLYIKMTGGCQGCASSQATLQDGIKRLVQQHFPEIEEVVDVTNHDAGENPYYS